MNHLTIFNQGIIPVYTTSTGEKVVIARELHDKLGINRDYSTWFKQMCEYGFEEGKDYSPFSGSIHGRGQPKKEHLIKFDMAKHIAMIQRSEIGMKIRNELIELEKKVNHRDSYMIEDPIERAKAWIKEQEVMKGLEAKNAQLTVSNEVMRPKAEFFDDLVDRNLLTSIRDTAKELRVKERLFVNFLIEKGFLFRDKKGSLKPKAGKGDGLFEVRESKNDKTGWVGQQTLVTPKGRETFRLLTEGLRDE